MSHPIHLVSNPAVEEARGPKRPIHYRTRHPQVDRAIDRLPLPPQHFPEHVLPGPHLPALAHPNFPLRPRVLSLEMFRVDRKVKVKINKIRKQKCFDYNNMRGALFFPKTPKQ